MSLIRRIMLGRRSFCTAVARKAEDIMKNPDCRTWELSARVRYLANSVGDLDTAARYSRLAVFSKPDDEPEIMANTCFDTGGCSKEIKTYNKATAESLLAYSVGFIPVTTFKTIIDVALKDGRIDDALKTSNKMFDMALKEVSKQFNPL